MSHTQSILPSSSLNKIQALFEKSIFRMGLSDYRVDIKGDTYPVHTATNAANLLPGLCMRAEQACINLFGGRLFKDIVYTVNTGQILGIAINNIHEVGDFDPNDPNFKRTMHIDPIQGDAITEGIKGLLMDMAITEQFEIDKESKLLISKPIKMDVHKLFRITPQYQDGQCIPLLDKSYGVLNDMHAMLYSEATIKALNKARERASEIIQERDVRTDFEMDQRF